MFLLGLSHRLLVPLNLAGDVDFNVFPMIWVLSQHGGQEANRVVPSLEGQVTLQLQTIPLLSLANQFTFTGYVGVCTKEGEMGVYVHVF